MATIIATSKQTKTKLLIPGTKNRYYQGEKEINWYKMLLTEDRWKLIHQLALLAYMNKGEEYKSLYQALLGAKVVSQVWKEFNGKDDVKTYRNEAILAVAQFVKDHPKASEKEIQKEVEKQIQIFVEKIQ